MLFTTIFHYNCGSFIGGGSTCHCHWKFVSQ